jgi:Flp pilus assembly protein protease CpaA
VIHVPYAIAIAAPTILTYPECDCHCAKYVDYVL